jgi:hypothetical protein
MAAEAKKDKFNPFPGSGHFSGKRAGFFSAGKMKPGK